MKIKKLVATTVLTVAATGITAATAYGSPEVSSETVLNGVDHGVQYTAAVATDRSDATITLASGKFVLTPDAGITVLAPDGSVVATVPTTLQTVAGQQVQVTPEVDAAATTLTLTPVNAPAPQSGPVQFIGDAGTTVAGVLIGCAVGALIGLLFFIVGFLPGCVIGGIIGGIAGANQ
ncbi:hypothetical protein [Nocardia vinacea]|uniref:hypothetical protein n=1 Tax=Nocardia vinacea TaxID=96468 RepID=UPI00030D2DB0|nr:hypothetical protein [Nocardia vinacea]